VNATALTAEVADAIGEIEAHYGRRASHEPDGQGGALVVLKEVELPSSWARRKAPLQFVIPFNFPATPPYPYYLPQDVQPPPPWHQAMQPIEWRGAQMIQVSLRNSNWSPARDNIVGCVMQVADWLASQ
jgi:hypothetical protein